MSAFLKRVFKVVTGSVGCLLLAVILAVAGILSLPEIRLERRALEIASNYLRSHGILDLSWRSGRVVIRSEGWLKKRVHVEFDELCARTPRSAAEATGTAGARWDACFGRVEASGMASLRGFEPRIDEIGPVDLRGGQVAFVPAEEGANATPPRDPAPAGKSGRGIPAFLKGTVIRPLHVDVPSWRVGSRENPSLAGSVKIDTAIEGSGAARIQGEAGIRLPGHGKGPGSSVDGTFELRNPGGMITANHWEARLRARGALGGGTARVSLEAAPRGAVEDLLFDYRLDGSFERSAGGRVTAQASGVAGPDRVETTLTATAREIVPRIALARVEGCKIALSRAPGEADAGIFRTDCPIYLRTPVLPKGYPKVELPSEIGARLGIDLKTGAYPPSPADPVDGTVTLKLNPVLTPLLDGRGTVESRLSGVPAEFPDGLRMDTDLGLALRVPRFQRLVRQLNETPFSVWAPLRPMDGEVLIEVSGRFDTEKGAAPLRLSTRLASEAQALDVDARGELRLERLTPEPKMHLALDVALNDVQLQLPPLPQPPSPNDPKLDQVPRFFPDSRIHRPVSAEKPPKPSVLGYDVAIHSPASHPVRLTTKLAKTPVPVALDLKLSDGQPISGSVRLKSFPLDLFHRDVKLEYFDIGLKEPSQDSDVNGRLVVPAGEYNVSVLVLGTLDRPRVKLLSDPPLPEDQIVGVLLYGKPAETLDPTETSSVAGTTAALRQGAFNLFSLYYLSALNIQHIDYDPKTKDVSVTFDLGSGTSLNVKEGGTEEQLGVRRRLSRHWAVTTQLNNPTDPTDRSLTAMLEWAYQY